MPVLKCLLGDLQGSQFILTDQPVTIGRDAKCVISAKDGRLSRNHAAVILKDGRCVIRDNKSSNGTYLNGIRLPAFETRQVFAGDDLRTGHMLLRYLQAEVNLKPDAIPGYTIKEIIDEDVSTVSFHATKESLAQDVALVLLRPDNAADARTRNQFREEARTAATLDHPNIAHVLDIGDDPARLYYTREWMDSPPLSYVMCSDLKPKIVAFMAKQLADAFDHAHEKGVLHTNLNPNWIHVDEKGTVKVRGIGVSHRFDEESDRLSYYLAPEQIERRPVDGRTDLYALGTILYQALAGHPVFDGITGDEVRTKILHAIPAPLASEAKDCPEELAKIIDKLIEREPSDRYHTAADLRDDLEAFLGGAPSSTAADQAQNQRKADEEKDAAAVASTPSPAQANRKTVAVRSRSATNSRSRSTEIASNRPPEKKDDTLLKVGIGLAVAAVLAIIGVAVLSSSGEDPVEIVTPDDLQPSAKELIKQGQDAIDTKDYAGARNTFQRVISLYGKDAQVRARAESALKQIDLLVSHNQTQSQFEQALTAYRTQKEETPDKIAELRAQLDAMREKFPDRADKLQVEYLSLENLSRETVGGVQDEIRALLTMGDIDGANRVLDQLQSRTSDPAVLKEIENQRGLIQSELDRLTGLYMGRLKEQYKNQMYAQMFETMKEAREKFQHAETLKKMAVTEKTVEGILSKKFAPLQEQIRILLGKRAFSEASQLLGEERPAFFGTIYENRVDEMTKAVQGSDRLHQYVIRQIQEQNPKPIPGNFSFPQIAKIKGDADEVVITEADLEEITVRAGNLIARVGWDELKRPQLLSVYELYAPNPGTPEAETLTLLRPMLSR